jgi:hypothetical protein
MEYSTDKLVNAWPNDDPGKPKQFYFGQYDGGTALGGHGAAYLPIRILMELVALPKYWNKLYTGNDPATRNYTGYMNNNGDAAGLTLEFFLYANVI